MTFPTAKMATRAHDVGAIALCGRSGCLNFADLLIKYIIKRVICIDFYITCQLNELNVLGQVDMFNK